jgi:cytochrome P450
MASLPKIEDFDDKAYDPFAAEVTIFGDIADLYTPLGQLRREAAVHRGAFMQLIGNSRWPIDHSSPAFAVLSYKHVNEVLSNPQLYSNSPFADTLGQTFGRTLSTMDPPEHTRYRRVFQKAFLPQHVAKWGETLVDPVVAQLIDKFKERGDADLIAEFTQTYPFEIIYRQLALPPGDGPIFHRLAVAQNMTATPEGREAARKLGAYFAALVIERRQNTGDDLASALVTATDGVERLPDEVTISFLRQLINAAGDTTFRGTSVLLTGLLQNPDQLEALRNDRQLMPQAIEEALRWEGPISWTERRATADSEIAGVKIPKGALITPVMAAANHDETVFPEPDSFNILRVHKSRNVAFAVGPHICLGQHLARLEINRAVNAIIDQLPSLRLDERRPPPIIRGAMMRYPRHLFVKFDTG